MWRQLLVGLVLFGLVPLTAAAQSPPRPPEGPMYTVSYVEVMPTARADAALELRRYREATRRADGNLRCEVLSRVGQAHHLVILEAWRDEAAREAHRASAVTRALREKIDAVRNAPLDERVHAPAAVGPLGPAPAGAVHVVTHVDVIPPRKDDGLAALKRLADDSRGTPGNARFEVVQQTNRPNHFTVIEAWASAQAMEAHSMRESTRRLRDALGPMSGSLHDERIFTLLD